MILLNVMYEFYSNGVASILLPQIVIKPIMYQKVVWYDHPSDFRRLASIHPQKDLWFWFIVPVSKSMSKAFKSVRLYFSSEMRALEGSARNMTFIKVRSNNTSRSQLFRDGQETFHLISFKLHNFLQIIWLVFVYQKTYILRLFRS